ncbi:hypothetical protein [Streptomyces sp. LS1784]|uniref:hypothetical protein n=1 Tax=Streptomyces sp. LS1784 TaxID=2851533 RepID=UPI001CCF0DC0|nr:hypothetical protein [Streptomyces sp. LS1784]
MSETPTEEPCQLCSQTRVLFTYEHQEVFDWGFGDTLIYQFCVRCWEKVEAAEEADNPLDLPYLTNQAKRYIAAMSRNAERALAVQPA